MASYSMDQHGTSTAKTVRSISGHSPNAPLISLRGAPVTVRNCLFVNGSAGAVDHHRPNAVFENNIILNTSGDSLVLRADGPGSLHYPKQYAALRLRSNLPSGNREIKFWRHTSATLGPRRSRGGFEHFRFR